ncbi:hypothetical protein KL86PLE_40564 [uncultured Pleomorphomonas sp.]|uniref:Uncharacterized protein n=1 Tax=uncultured Pleomorphomonas sp. TaxID=442121 RepID=A0A212LHA9_9HYPH|nr:hypothetical protein KL86PLE_40564 [uncultured Pleomorphomonas sp.]
MIGKAVNQALGQFTILARQDNAVEVMMAKKQSSARLQKTFSLGNQRLALMHALNDILT